MTPQKGDKLVVRRGAVVQRYGAIPGDRFKRTETVNKRRRHITVDRVSAYRYWHTEEGSFSEDQGPWVEWAGEHGYWHWCLLTDCELP